MKNFRSQEEPLRHQNLDQTIKSEISKLGSKAKVCMDENQILIQTMKQQYHFLTESKKNLKKYTTTQHINTDIQRDLTSGNTDLSKINKTLRSKRFSLRQRYHNLTLNMDQNLNYLKGELDLLSERKFIYENALIAKDINIKILQKTLDNILENSLEREDIREIYSKDLDEDEDEMIKDLEHFQKTLLSELKSFNKYHNRCEKLQKELSELNSKINNKNEIPNLNKNNITINDSKFANDDLNSNIIDESSSYYDDDSFYEDPLIDYDSMNFQDMVSDKCYLKKKNYGKILNIPIIDLKQIEFNKKKIKQEDAEKSLSREFEDSDSEVNKKIKKIKEKIKKIKKKSKKKLKLKELEKKIMQMKKIIKNYTKCPVKEQSKSVRIDEPNSQDNRKAVTEINQTK